MPNGRQRGGFNPDRMADLTRTVSVVPQIVEAPRPSAVRVARDELLATTRNRRSWPLAAVCTRRRVGLGVGGRFGSGHSLTLFSTISGARLWSPFVLPHSRPSTRRRLPWGCPTDTPQHNILQWQAFLGRLPCCTDSVIGHGNCATWRTWPVSA